MNVNQIVDDVLEKELRERKIGHYYISEIPYCMRTIWFRYKKPKKIDADTARIFERGNILHGWLSRILSRSNTLKIIENEARLIIPINGIFLRGRVDDFVIIEEFGEKKKYVLEIKTTANISAQTQISPHHLMQITPYLMIENDCIGKIIYIDARYLRIKEFETKLDWNIWNEIKKRTADLHSFLIADKLPPAEAKEKNRGWECGNCPYFEECRLEMV